MTTNDIATKAAAAWRKELRQIADDDELEQLRRVTLEKIAAAELAMPSTPRVIVMPLEDVKALLALAEKAIDKGKGKGKGA